VPVSVSLVLIAAAIAVGEYARAAVMTAPGGGVLVPRMPPPPPDLRTLLFQLGVGSVVWYVAALSLPLLLGAARYLDVERLGVAKTAGIVIGAAVALVAITAVIDYRWTFRSAHVRPALGAYAPMALRQHGLPLVALVGLTAAVEARRRAVQTAIERERLRAEVARQRLIALSGQLRPHFLFNSLQAISSLIHRDPAAADEMLTRLSDLLRDVLRHRDTPFVRLEDEIGYARTWLEIAKIRFGDRLEFEIDVPVELHEMAVPLFILQPLLENALTHGIGAVMRGGRVTVRARQAGSRLRLEVVDDGAGVKPALSRREGIGLGNTRERLKASYEADFEMRCEPGPSRGTLVSIEFPARRQPAEVPA
jgi:hypothetical protein